MKKKLFPLLLCAALVLSVGMAAYAATGGFTMTYEPGASGVINMPQDDYGTGGTPYAVSPAVPQRAGYEFLGWQLDYGKAPTVVSYTVWYIDRTTGKKILPDKFVTDVEAGTHVIEYPEEVEGYKPMQHKYEWDVAGDEVKVFIYYEDREPILS